MEVACQLIIEPAVKALTGYITQKLRNFTSSADRVKEMIKKMERLDAQRVDNENHLRSNRENNKEIPARVPGWLEEVENIKKEVEKIPINDIGCFNVKKKYLAGRNALTHIKDIHRLIEESKGIIWSDAQIPLGRVDSKRPASTSTSGGNTQIMFKSRDKIFDDALKFLQHDDDKTRVIALCGMGGVGKTTLKDDLKKVATDNKMFDWIVDVPIGKSSNLFKIQKVIAADTGKPLTETDETLMATSLSKRFEEFSERNERCLVILDNVWERINLKDIGLASPLPKGVKLLLTSRNADICHQIALDAGRYALQAVRVGVLEEEEARDFFCQITKISAEHDRDLYAKGCKIVKKCGYLPLAIKLIAATLNSKDEYLWRHTLKRLKKNDLGTNVQKIISISYECLVHDDKAIFLLCGLFPEDSNIPIEDLTRYAWGLKLLNKVYTMKETRDSIQISVRNLKNAYLLMNGDSRHSDSVKMHDLVLAFVVGTVSKGGEDGCWIIHHEDDFSNWSEANSMSQSCKRLSLTCKGMSEFPSEFQFPNLSLLKLMHGDESLRAPQDFYATMEKLQVIAIEKLEYPPVPASFQCSTNLRTLCLHECSLMFDLNCIGNLLNLEVLSFANSGITILPSTFENLKQLRLLDVTGCYNLVIDDGVLKSLEKLEELYMRSFEGCALCFTDNNSSELAERSENLRALEFEFIADNAHMKNMSYEKLRRFKLSVGRSFTEVRNALRTRQVDTHSYENSLKLITNREELLKSKINELFKITDALYLRVNDMNNLEDVDVESLHPPHPRRYSSFYNLRVLVVSECAELKYLFTMNLTRSLSKLEYLDISGCPIMEVVIHTKNDGSDVIRLSSLKYLRLAKLPKLLHFCNKVDAIALPRLRELQLEGLPKFTSIYPDGAIYFVSSNISPTQFFLSKEDATPKLEKLFVKDCDSIEALFNMDFRQGLPKVASIYSAKSSVSTLSKLEYLDISGCPNMEAVIHAENEFMTAENEGLNIMFSNLKYLRLAELPKLLHFCNKVDAIALPRLRELQLEGLPKFASIYPDGETYFVSSNISPTQFFLSKEDATLKLEKLFIKDCDSIEVLFNMDFGEIKQLRSGLRSIKVDGCNSLVKLFSCNPFPFFNNLQELDVRMCRSIKVLFEIDSGRAGRYEEQDATPKLEKLFVSDMENLTEIWSPQFSSSKLPKPKPKVLKIKGCNRLEHIFTFSTLQSLTQLEELEVKDCKAMEVIVTEEIGQQMTASDVVFRHLKSLILVNLPNFVGFFLGKNEFTWPALEKVVIGECPQITVFTYGRSTAPKLNFINTSLGKHSVECGLNFHVTTTSHQARLPSYESTSSYCPTTMERLPWSYHNLIEVDTVNTSVGQTLFSSDKLLQLQKLETVHCRKCWDIEEIFDSQTVAEIPNLRQVELWWLDSLEYIWKSKQGTVLKFPSLTRLSIDWCSSLEYVFTCPMVGSLLQLQELYIRNCESMKVIVKGEEEECDAIVNAIVEFPCLRSLKLLFLDSLEGFCLGNEAFEFPSLDTLVIDGCHKMTVFTKGDLSAPKLHAIDGYRKKYNIHNRPLNSFLNTLNKRRD